MTERRRSILVVQPDTAQQAALGESLHGFQVTSAASKSAALDAIAASVPDLLIVPATGARALLRELDQLAPNLERVVLYSEEGGEREALADIAAAGLRFHAVSQQPAHALRTGLLEVLQPRQTSRMAALRRLEAHFTAGGRAFQGTCLDLAPHGIRIWLSPDLPVEGLLPGVALEDLRLRSGEAVLLGPATATVRHVRATPEGGIQVGIALGDPRRGTSDSLSVADPVRIGALVRRCLARKRPIVLGLPDRAEPPTSFSSWELCPSADGPARIRVHAAAGWAVGEVLELSLDLAGKAHLGMSPVLHVEPGAFELAVPTRVVARHRRASVRFAVPPGHGFTVRFRSPLTGAPISAPVFDLHPTGLAFDVDAASGVGLTGLRLEELEVELPDGKVVRCAGELRAVRPLAGSPGRLRCGLKLQRPGPQLRRSIAAAFFAARCPAVTDASEVPLREIWDLARRAGHFYFDYPMEPGPHLEVLERAHRLAGASEEGLVKTLAWREGDALAGFYAGLRIYSGTWINQHLAVEPGFRRGESVSRDLTALGLDYLELLPDVEFFRSIWRTENRWADKMNGTLHRALGSGGLNGLRFTNYLRLEGELAVPAAAPSLQVRPASLEDLRAFERHLRMTGQMLRMRSDDLTAHEMALDTLGARFAANGLERSRRIYVVHGQRGPLAFALHETCTPGLCWPEITNAFSLEIVDACDPDLPAAADALVRHAVAQYRHEGAPPVRALAADGQVQLFERLGFTSHGRVAEWTFHRSAVRACHDLLTGMFERLARRPGRLA